MCETEKCDWDITVCCFKHCTVESILRLVLYRCPRFLYLHIFFSSDSKFYWILSQERMCRTTKYGIQYCLRVLVHVFVFKISQYCSVVFAADILAFIGYCRLLNVFLKQATMKLFQAVTVYFFHSTSFSEPSFYWEYFC